MDNKPAAVTSIVAGAAAGATETLITYPAEYIKTRRQLPTSPTGTTSTPIQVHHGPKTSYQILRETLHHSGFRGLYSGCSALCASNAAKGSIRFISFTQSQAYIKKTRFGTAHQSLGNVIAGLIAGATESVLVVTPGESLKTKMIHNRALLKECTRGTPSLVQIAAHVVKTQGIGSLWQGLGPVLCKQATNSAVRFATYGLVLDSLETSFSMSGTKATLVAGAFSGVVTTYASMPFDNIKTRMQSIDRSNRQSMWKTAQSMLKAEGIFVFWRATTPRLMRLTMSSSITFTVFDAIVSLAAKMQHQPLMKDPVHV